MRPVFEWFVILLTFGVVGCWLRSVHRVKYAILEIAVGSVMAWYSITVFLQKIKEMEPGQFERFQSEALTGLLGIIGGSYVIIRGLDNFENGLVKKQSILLPLWKAIFHWNWLRKGRIDGLKNVARALFGSRQNVSAVQPQGNAQREPE
jgi:hypothetical protein